MSCPLFVDYTRECVEIYPEIVQISSYDICQSNNYETCPVYIMIKSPEKNCENTVKCYVTFFKFNLEISIEKLTEIAEKYCFNEENREKCEIYKIIESGDEIPRGLLGDGSIAETKK